MAMNQLSVFVENKPGAMRAMTKVLAENGVNMQALSLAETADFGIARIIVDNVYEATTVLKNEGYVHSLTPVVGVAVPNVPGGLNSVLNLMADAGINIEYMYACFSGGSDHTYMIFKVADVTAATAVLKANRVQMIG